MDTTTSDKLPHLSLKERIRSIRERINENTFTDTSPGTIGFDKFRNSNPWDKWDDYPSFDNRVPR